MWWQTERLLGFFGSSSSNRGAPGGVPPSSVAEVASLGLGFNPTALAHGKGPWFVIDPAASGRQRWDVLMAALILYSVIVIPYRICFEVDASGWLLVVDILVDVAFGVDIAVNFLTAFRRPDGSLVVQPRAIAKNYVRGYFAVDLLSTLPVDQVVAALTQSDTAAFRFIKLIRAVRLFRLLKLVRLFKLHRVVGQVESSLCVSPAVLRLGRLFFQVSFIAHLMSCFWFYVSILDDSSGADWWSTIGIERGDTYNQYVAALYFSFATMSTVGYGDILPVTTPERLYVIFAMFVGATVFGYVVGAVAALVSQLDAARQRAKGRLGTVKAWLQEQEVSLDVRRKVLRHFNFVMDCQTAMDEAALLAAVPPSLRADVVLYVHRGTVSTFSLLEGITPIALSSIVAAFAPALLPAGETIFRAREAGRVAYFITKGSVVLHRYGTVDDTASEAGHRRRSGQAASMRVIAEEGEGEGGATPTTVLDSDDDMAPSTARHTRWKSSTRVAPNDAPAGTSVVGEGNVVGEIAVLTPCRYNARATASRPCNALSLSRSDFLENLRLFPASLSVLEQRLFETWARRHGPSLHLLSRSAPVQVTTLEQLHSYTRRHGHGHP